VRLRHKRKKGSGSRDACLAMVYKLVEHAQRHWRKLDGAQLLLEVLAGKRFIDGMIDTTQRDAACPSSPRPIPNIPAYLEVEQLLLLSGWTLERTRGSHKHYRKGTDRVTVPLCRGTILAAYVRDVLRRTPEDGDD